MGIYALVVNPKNRAVVYARQSEGEPRSMGIHDIDDERLGNGYFDDEKDLAAQITGYPRVHTPDGVKIEGQGYGSVLYTALCTAAHLNYSRKLMLPTPVRADGISSTFADGGRTDAASSWWNAALERGLAKEKKKCERRERGDIFVRSKDAPIDIDPAVHSLVKTAAGGNGRVTDWYLRATYTGTVCQTAQVYPYSSVLAHQLVPCTFASKKQRTAELWKVKPSSIIECMPAAWIGIDFGRLRQWNDSFAIEIATLLFNCAAHCGVSRADVDLMRTRFLAAADIEPAWAKAYRAVAPKKRTRKSARRNPAEDESAEIPGIILYEPGSRRGPRKNPSARTATRLPRTVDQGKLREALQRAQEVRVALGWDMLAAFDNT